MVFLGGVGGRSRLVSALSLSKRARALATSIREGATGRSFSDPPSSCRLLLRIQLGLRGKSQAGPCGHKESFLSLFLKLKYQNCNMDRQRKPVVRVKERTTLHPGSVREENTAVTPKPETSCPSAETKYQVMVLSYGISFSEIILLTFVRSLTWVTAMLQEHFRCCPNERWRSSLSVCGAYCIPDRSFRRSPVYAILLGLLLASDNRGW